MLVPTLTFVATANAVTYTGATPVFVDAELAGWTLDVEVVAHELPTRRASGGQLPAAIVSVDLYGQCADYARLLPLAADHGIPVISDAAEALGSARAGRPAGSFGQIGALSFIGNKTITTTTSGGGALVTDDRSMADRVRKLATQVREPVAHYEHREVGFNYRLSNLLAALGRGRLASLDAKVARRRAINATYRQQLADLPGVRFMAADPDSDPSWWLTCLTVDPARSGTTRDELIEALAAEDIEARPVWKLMHLQPAFADHFSIGGEVAAGLFADGLCLPSGSSLTWADQERIVTLLREHLA